MLLVNGHPRTLSFHRENSAFAAGFLRDAAEQCADPWRRQRLMRAADALIAGESLALTPEGQAWQPAAAAQTVGIDEWVEPPEPVYRKKKTSTSSWKSLNECKTF